MLLSIIKIESKKAERQGIISLAEKNENNGEPKNDWSTKINIILLRRCPGPPEYHELVKRFGEKILYVARI